MSVRRLHDVPPPSAAPTIPREHAAAAAPAVLDRRDAALVVPAMGTTLPGRTVDPVEQGRLVNQAVLALRQARKLGLGASGKDIVGAVETLDLSAMWVNPGNRIDYSDEELEDTAKSMAAAGRPDTPLVVCYAPHPQRPSAQYMIVDGKKRYEAASRIMLTTLPVIVRTFATFYDAMMVTVRGKATQHQLTDLELADLIAALQAAHKAARMDHPQMGKFPTLEELGGLIGLSNGELSRRLRLALSRPLRSRIEDGAITPTQARELLSAPLPVQEMVAAQVATLNAEAVAAGEQPVSHKRVRQMVGERLRGPAQWIGQDLVPAPNAAQLYLDDLLDEPAPVAVGMLLHDIEEWLHSAETAYAHPHQDIRDLLRILQRPNVRALIDAAASAHGRDARRNA